MAYLNIKAQLIGTDIVIGTVVCDAIAIELFCHV